MCLLISSALPSTPTSALEMLLIITPNDKFILPGAGVKANGVKYNLTNRNMDLLKIDSSQKIISHVDACNRAQKDLPL